MIKMTERAQQILEEQACITIKDGKVLCETLDHYNCVDQFEVAPEDIDSLISYLKELKIEA